MQHRNDLEARNYDKAMPVCHFDPEEYRGFLSELEMSDAQKDELLGILWNIVSSIVDISWGEDNIQMYLSPVFDETGQDSRKLVEHRGEEERQDR